MISKTTNMSAMFYFYSFVAILNIVAGINGFIKYSPTSDYHWVLFCLYTVNLISAAIFAKFSITEARKK
jgi:hypothetical protein